MATAKKAPAKTTAPAAEGAAPAAKKRTPNAAFMKALTPSAALAAVVGAAPLPRTEVISKLWVYIKAENLQEPTNKRMINADAKLKKVFDKPQVSMFEMAGLIGKHLS
ncbi:MAG: DNA topoisomerase III [Giesbergeria sp.]|nr:DNA topoisomerase III [Giesbergeria sp.]